MSQQRFSYHHQDGQDKRLGVAIEFSLGQGISFRDRVFYVVTEFGQYQGLFFSRQGIFMSLCREIIFLCLDRVLAKARRFLVVTVYF